MTGADYIFWLVMISSAIALTALFTFLLERHIDKKHGYNKYRREDYKDSDWS